MSSWPRFGPQRMEMGEGHHWTWESGRKAFHNKEPTDPEALFFSLLLLDIEPKIQKLTFIQIMKLRAFKVKLLSLRFCPEEMSRGQFPLVLWILSKNYSRLFTIPCEVTIQIRDLLNGKWPEHRENKLNYRWPFSKSGHACLHSNPKKKYSDM